MQGRDRVVDRVFDGLPGEGWVADHQRVRAVARGRGVVVPAAVGQAHHGDDAARGVVRLDQDQFVINLDQAAGQVEYRGRVDRERRVAGAHGGGQLGHALLIQREAPQLPLDPLDELIEGRHGCYRPDIAIWKEQVVGVPVIVQEKR
ncbi:GvpL/GvpF family gas vesicle protein [Streptomyces coeruleoprunus]|uniref:GvpL/GvpF family gas vesicle protein n=1 Tax=Streptomyces coeruleoprunus TaxID=285563 RepID=A0ABV9XGD2_9ACTN